MGVIPFNPLIRWIPILRFLRKMRHDEDLRADWRFVAMVIDRIMVCDMKVG